MHFTASPLRGSSNLSPSSKTRNADYTSPTSPGRSGLLLPSGGNLRHAFLLGEYRDFAVLADALGLHRAVPLEQRAFLHRQHRRRDVSADLRRRANFDPLGRDDVAADLAGDRHRRGADVRGDHGGLADGQAVLGVDLAVNLAVDSRGTLERD